MLLKVEKENQIQDLWNRGSKSNVKIWQWLVNLRQNPCETLSTMFNGSLIDRANFYHVTFNF